MEIDPPALIRPSRVCSPNQQSDHSLVRDPGLNHQLSHTKLGLGLNFCISAPQYPCASETGFHSSGEESALPVQETQETQVWSLSWEDFLKKEMATYFSILVWRIPWTEEPGRLTPGGQTRLSTHTPTHTRTLCMGLFLGFLSCSIDLYFYFLPTLHCFDDYRFKYSLMSGRLIPPALVSSLVIALAIWSLLCFHANFF